MKKNDNLEFQPIIASEMIYDGKIIKVRKDQVRLPDGSIAMREIVTHYGGVCILVVDGDYTYIVRQFRNPSGKVLVELPAGKLEKDEDPTAAAIREVSEEVGLIAKSIHSLGKVHSSPGFCSEVIYLYYCDEFEKGDQHLDEDEYLRYEKISLKEFEKMILSGEIEDAKTLAVYLRYKLLKEQDNA